MAMSADADVAFDLKEQQWHARQKAAQNYRRLAVAERFDGKGRSGKMDEHGPTSYLPGTWEKILVMQDRLERGVGLFHPDDARLDEE